MKKTDARILRSRRLLRDALIRLAVERPYEEITVRELTQVAEVGYATFFRHYKGKDDLLFSILDEIIHEVGEVLVSEAGDDPYKTGLLIFKQVQEKHDLYKVLLSGSTRGPVLGRVHAAISEHFRHTHQSTTTLSVPLEIAANHVSQSTISLIQWWIDHGMPYTPEEMAAIYMSLIIKPFQPYPPASGS